MVKIDNLADAIAAELSSYTAEVTAGVKQACKDVSKEMTKNIKTDSPQKTGEYRKGWRTKTEYEDKNNIRIRTYNLKRWALTHLLEFGHAKRGGGRVRAYPHIKKNEEKASKEVVGRIERVVKG